jgi:RNA polymerase subunit RPABC4/transcription elongation factor Spt4
MSEEFIKAIANAIEEITGGTAIEFPASVDQGDPATRRQIAKLICSNPELYKVCCGCEAIVREPSPVCPQCNAYRFETDASLIREQASILANRLPTTWLN